MHESPWQIAPPSASQRGSILALLPRLADFDIPRQRDPHDLWQGDASLVKDWFAGTTKDVHLLSASTQAGEVAGIAVFALRPEFLNDAPSSHLEALAVDAAFEGQGVASQLLDACHKQAQQLGAKSMTLHVFETNARALALYRHKGYTPELRRCIKWFEES